MHLTRPKSSKRRSRPAVNSFICTSNSDSIPRPPGSPVNRRPDSSLLSSLPGSEMLQTKRLAKHEVLHVLQQGKAAAPPQPLNKYNVLPPIERRRQSKENPLKLNKMMSTLDLPDDAFTQPRSSDEYSTAEGRFKILPEPSDPAPAKTKAAGTSGSLLLAIRAPCGRRFEQRFDPSDTLLAVRASAEVRYGVRYEDAYIEAIAVPRRALTDLNMTLAQCGILNRSVLCISQSNASMAEQERD